MPSFLVLKRLNGDEQICTVIIEHFRSVNHSLAET